MPVPQNPLAPSPYAIDCDPVDALPLDEVGRVGAFEFTIVSGGPEPSLQTTERGS